MLELQEDSVLQALVQQLRIQGLASAVRSFVQEIEIKCRSSMLDKVISTSTDRQAISSHPAVTAPRCINFLHSYLL